MSNENEIDRDFGDSTIEPEINNENEDGYSNDLDEEVEGDNSKPLESEEDDEEEQNKESKKKPARKDNIRDRYNEVRRENYQRLAENDALRAENEKLRNDISYAVKTTVSHYEDGVEQRFNNAKKMYAEAEESGDVHAKADAAAELSLISAERHAAYNRKAEAELQNRRYQEEVQYQQQQMQQPSQVDYARQRDAEQWRNDNEWFNEKSKSYDPWLSDKVNKFANEFEQNLYYNNMGHEIGKHDYMQIVNNKINEFRAERQSQNGNNRGPNMSQSRMPVSSVRNSGRNSSQNSGGRQLNNTEKRMAAALGMSEDVYSKYIHADERVNADLRANVNARK